MIRSAIAIASAMADSSAGEGRAASMSSLALINSLPIPPVEADFLAADARKLYRHADELIFLFLIVGGEGVLVHDDNRGILCAACPRKVWEHLFDSSDEVGFLPRKVGLVPARHDRHPNSSQDFPVFARNTNRWLLRAGASDSAR